MATQKKYVCAFCTRAFTRSEHKQRHERSHTNEKPFHCTHCSAAFVRRDLLHRHCRTVHSIQMKQNGSDVAHRDSNATPTKNDTTVAKNQAAPYVGVSGTNTTSSTSELTKYSAFKSDTSQFIHLLSVTKKLETLLVSYDPHTDHADVKSTFLIGYTVLDSDKRFPIFGLLGNDLLQFLNSNVSSQKIVDFKICIIYSILATGVANNDDMKHYNEYINKAWSLLITKLIPNYNSNLNPNDQIEILTNLFLLAYTFLTYNSQEFQGNNANCDLIFNYLDEISYIIVSNLSHKTNELIDSNMSLFWSIYVLLSNYMLSTVPPKFYRFFLDKKVNGVVLSTLMENFSRTVVALDDTFDKEIVISTLSNEINLYNHFQKLFIFESKNTLHNSIILVNKTINQIHSHNELFDLFKKKLIVNSPSKFHELLNIYVFNPKSLHNWYLLIASLKEYNSPFDFNRFLAAYLSEPNFERFDQNLRPFFQNDAIKNNLVIVSFPLIFNSKFLNISNESLKIVDFTNFSFKDYQNLRTFIIEWYVTMLKTIIWLFRSQDYSFILQNLVYIVLGKNSEEFKLDEKWFWVLKLKLDSLFEHWLTYVKNDLSDLSSLRSNLNRFTNNMIRELLNYNAFGGAPSLSPITSQRSNSLSMGTLLSSQQSPYNHFSKPLTSLGVELPPTKENNAHFSSYTTITPFNSLPYPQASNYVPHSRTEGSTFPSFMKYEFPYQVNVNPSVAPKSNGSN